MESWHPDESRPGLLEDLRGQFVGIGAREIHGYNVRVHQHLRAYSARLVCAVQLGSLNGHAVICRLNDGVLLGVKTAAELVALAGRNAKLLAQASSLGAVAEAARNAVVT